MGGLCDNIVNDDFLLYYKKNKKNITMVQTANVILILDGA